MVEYFKQEDIDMASYDGRQLKRKFSEDKEEFLILKFYNYEKANHSVQNQNISVWNQRRKWD